MLTEATEDLRRRVLERIRWPAQENAVPRQIYTDPELFELEMEAIFRGPTWHGVAHDAELPAPGDYKTTRLGGVPALVSRDRGGQVHVLVNACAHRGAQVVKNLSGNAARTAFQCGYHLWTYDLDGTLKGVTLPDLMPETFRKEDHCLPRLRHDRVAGLIFCTLSDATPPLREYLGDPEFAEALDEALCDGKLELLGSQKLVFHCNWKIYAENMSDGYHSRVLHAGARFINGPPTNLTRWAGRDPSHGKYGHYWTRGHNTPPQHTGELKDNSIVEVRAKPADETGLPRSNLALIFPDIALSDNNDALHIRYIRPLDVERTQVEFTYFARPEESAEIKLHRARTGSNCYGPVGLITLEDGQAFGRVQRGAAAADAGANYILAGWRPQSADGEPAYSGEAHTVNFYSAYRQFIGF
jgi:phenylpropionate dioxygenase-like ring-hydroxylating dioxygenase large terminal subunit